MNLKSISTLANHEKEKRRPLMGAGGFYYFFKLKKSTRGGVTSGNQRGDSSIREKTHTFD